MLILLLVSLITRHAFPQVPAPYGIKLTLGLSAVQQQILRTGDTLMCSLRVCVRVQARAMMKIYNVSSDPKLVGRLMSYFSLHETRQSHHKHIQYKMRSHLSSPWWSLFRIGPQLPPTISIHLCV